MPLPTPILDDRSWQQLCDELVQRIPVYAPEWTDHNPSDPGITLLELFAFLGENLLFRFNQIPEATRLEFLNLLESPRRAARPSRAMLALTPPTASPVLVQIGTEAKAGAVAFETQDEVHVWPLTVRAVARRIAEEPQSPEARIYADVAIAARELKEGEEAVFYVAEVLGEDPSEPGFTPVDFGATVDGILWVAVLRTDDTDVASLASAVLNLGFVPDPEVPTMDEVDACPGPASGDRSDEVVWEYSTAEVRGAHQPVFRPLTLVGDTTRGLARQGVVRLRLPRDPTEPGLPLPDDPDLVGTGAFPPELNDEELAADLLFWIRAYRRRDDRRLSRTVWVGANATEVLQVRSARTEFLGTGTGGAEQRYALVHRPVVAGSLVLQVEEPGGWTTWAEVDGFAGSGAEDRVYTVDSEAGTVRFGGGPRGRVPQIGERIRALRYRYGGGRQGNVPAGEITRLGAAGVDAWNPRPAFGGADTEPVADALERIPGELRRRDRAVTASDFRELALATPGAGVGRAEVLARFHPPTRLREAAGVVTVVVWPQEDPRRPNAPMPDRDLLRAVCEWLDARRLVTTELYVVPPTYRRVAVSVGLQAKPGFGIEAVRQWVELVLRQYLAPLPPFGPSGEGWPLGRRVHGPELEAAALQVEGVEYLEGLRVSRQQVTPEGEEWIEGTVLLEPYEVPELAAITVVEGEPLEPGAELMPPAGTTPTGREPVAVPIPTLREVC
jgi:predicted phage baseplate assembly protein